MAKKKQSIPSTSKPLNPIAPKVSGEFLKEVVSISDPDTEIYKNLSTMIEAGEAMRGQWSLKRDFFFRMRMRMRKEKSHPFPGCSNLRLPTAEKFIRKIKAALYNVSWGSNPRTVVTPEPNGTMDIAMKLEHYLDWLFDMKVKFGRKLVLLIDKVLSKGFAFCEVIWRISDEKRYVELNLQDLPIEIQQAFFAIDVDLLNFIEPIAKILGIDMSETVREENTQAITKALNELLSGQESVRLRVCDEVYNNVDVNILDPENVYVPVDSFLDPQQARWIAVETFEQWQTVKEKARLGIYSDKAVDEMKAFSAIKMPELPTSGSQPYSGTKTSFISEDTREGIERVTNQSRNVKIWRVYAWYDLDGDGIEERNVFILAPEWKKVLAKFPFTYAHRKWPIVRFDAEVFDDRWYSPRGVPEMLEDIIKEIDTQHNQKIDQQTIRNTPMFTFRSGIVNPRMIKFIPGNAIPVNGLTPLDDAIKVLRNESTNAEFSYRDEEFLLKGECQELYGQTDYSMQSMINRRQPRTASEVMAQQQSSNSVFTMDSTLFNESLSEVFEQALQLSQQYLPEQIFFSVVGEGGSIRLSREEIQGDYIVRVRGKDVLASPTTRLQLAQAKISFLMSPYNLQSGIVTPVNVYLLMKEYLQLTGDFSWQQKLTIPQPPPPPKPPPAITQIKLTGQDLTPVEKAQVLQSGGIQPDLQGHLLEKQLEIASEMESQEPVESNGGGYGEE